MPKSILELSILHQISTAAVWDAGLFNRAELSTILHFSKLAPSCTPMTLLLFLQFSKLHISWSLEILTLFFSCPQFIGFSRFVA
jgi:hypothetical protein